MANDEDVRLLDVGRGSPTPTRGGSLTRRRMMVVAIGGAAGAMVGLSGCGSDGASSTERDEPVGGSPGPGGSGGTAPGGEVVVHASPSCGCCGEYADYLGTEGGYIVDLRRTDDLDTIRADAGVPQQVAGCHTTLLGDYVIEGHVPLEAIDELLQQRPSVDGISLPGMPTGSPGMGGSKRGPFEILSFSAGEVRSFTTV